MKSIVILLVLAFAAFSCVSATATSSLVEVEVEADACTYGGQMGSCIPDSSPCTGLRYSGLCSGSSTVRCCLPSAQALFGDNGNGARITQTTLQRLSESQHQEKWNRWKSIHKPTFSSTGQEQEVYAVFRDNRVRTIYLNDRFGNGQTVWSSATKFAPYRPDSFAAQKLTFRAPAVNGRRSLLEMSNANANQMEMGTHNNIPVDDSIQWKTFQKLASSLRSTEKEAGITSFLESETSSSVGGPAYDEWLKTHGNQQKKEEEKKKYTDGPVTPDKPQDISAVAKLQGKLIVDYRNLIGPVRNQQTCGSCWAFATTAVVEAAMSRAGIPMKTIAPQFLVDCITEAPNQRCSGGFSNVALQRMQTLQPATEAELPYASAENACTLPNGGKSGILISESGFATQCAATNEDLTCNSAKDNVLLDILKKYGPVSVHMDASNWGSYRGGLMKGDSCKHGWQDLNHAVVLVGYGQQDDGQFYWLIRNHWGDSWWGEEGYLRVEAGGYACGAPNWVVYANVKKA